MPREEQRGRKGWDPAAHSRTDACRGGRGLFPVQGKESVQSLKTEAGRVHSVALSWLRKAERSVRSRQWHGQAPPLQRQDEATGEAAEDGSHPKRLLRTRFRLGR